ncbi:hypothetical protein [Tianweitania sediminis]|uniref:Uncharacterized protein n=1 Tax=Tianweitania sediminis TaxID=1502156 RepID=A0A8J7R4R9_9HYPH|nr:hypothetical protein [Tianweitania sediminis]MBP0440791.1 hypothetical protein [Tianweitania sediminis]
MTNANRRSSHDTARLEYIHAMLGQLQAMARGEQADMVAYLIELAYIEAGDVLRGERPFSRVELPGNVHQRDSAA